MRGAHRQDRGTVLGNREDMIRVVCGRTGRAVWQQQRRYLLLLTGVQTHGHVHALPGAPGRCGSGKHLAQELSGVHAASAGRASARPVARSAGSLIIPWQHNVAAALPVGNRPGHGARQQPVAMRSLAGARSTKRSDLQCQGCFMWRFTDACVLMAIYKIMMAGYSGWAKPKVCSVGSAGEAYCDPLKLQQVVEFVRAESR